MKMLDVPQSGSLAGQTSSRNAFGQYRRTRAVPVNPNSAAQVAVRARLSTNAAAWQSLTGAQRAGWATLGEAMTRTDSLGQTYHLSGFQAYCSVNNNKLAAGDAVVADAPELITPAALTTVTVTATDAALSVAYTTTPLAAGVRAFIYVSKQRSPGRGYESDLRLLTVTAAAAASPANIFAAYVARFGTTITGRRIFYSVELMADGFLGPALSGSVVVA